MSVCPGSYPDAGMPKDALFKNGSDEVHILYEHGDRRTPVCVGHKSGKGLIRPELALRTLSPSVWVKYYGDYGAYSREQATGPLLYTVRHELFADLYADLCKSLGQEQAHCLMDTSLRLFGDYFGASGINIFDDVDAQSPAMLLSVMRHDSSWYFRNMADFSIEQFNDLSGAWSRRLYDYACSFCRQDMELGKIGWLDVSSPDNVWLTVRAVPNQERPTSFEEEIMCDESDLETYTVSVQAVHAGSGLVICSMTDQEQPARSTIIERMVETLKEQSITVHGAVCINGMAADLVDHLISIDIPCMGIMEKYKASFNNFIDYISDLEMAQPATIFDYDHECAFEKLTGYRASKYRGAGGGALEYHGMIDMDVSNIERSMSMIKNRTNVTATIYTENLSRDPYGKRESPYDNNLTGDEFPMPVHVTCDHEVIVSFKGMEKSFLKEGAQVARKVRFLDNSISTFMAGLHGNITCKNPEFINSFAGLSRSVVSASLAAAWIFNIFFTRDFSTRTIAWNYGRMANLMGVRCGLDCDYGDGSYGQLKYRRLSLDKTLPWYLRITDQDGAAMADRCLMISACFEPVVSRVPLKGLCNFDALTPAWVELVSMKADDPQVDDRMRSFVEDFIALISGCEATKPYAGEIIDEIRSAFATFMEHRIFNSEPEQTKDIFARKTGQGVVTDPEDMGEMGGLDLMFRSLMVKDDTRQEFIDVIPAGFKAARTELFRRPVFKDMNFKMSVDPVDENISDRVEVSDFGKGLLNLLNEAFKGPEYFKNMFGDVDPEALKAAKSKQKQMSEMISRGNDEKILHEIEIPAQAYADPVSGLVYSGQPVTITIAPKRVPKSKRKKQQGQKNEARTQTRMSGIVIGKVTTQGRMMPNFEMKKAMPEVWDEMVKNADSSKA